MVDISSTLAEILSWKRINSVVDIGGEISLPKDYSEIMIIFQGASSNAETSITLTKAILNSYPNKNIYTGSTSVQMTCIANVNTVRFTGCHIDGVGYSSNCAMIIYYR